VFINDLTKLQANVLREFALKIEEAASLDESLK
jgi:hypothetical protein